MRRPLIRPRRRHMLAALALAAGAGLIAQPGAAQARHDEPPRDQRPAGDTLTTAPSAR